MTKVPYKATPTIKDAGIVYAPYIPLRSIETTWKIVGFDGLLQKKVYNVYRHEITQWIESQPVHMWKFYDLPESMALYYNAGQNYIFTEEMEMLFILRWS